jgi:hypothetical protein
LGTLLVNIIQFSTEFNKVQQVKWEHWDLYLLGKAKAFKSVKLARLPFGHKNQRHGKRHQPKQNLISIFNIWRTKEKIKSHASRRLWVRFRSEQLKRDSQSHRRRCYSRFIWFIIHSIRSENSNRYWRRTYLRIKLNFIK